MTTASDVTRLSATGLARAIHRRDISPVEAVEAHIRRIEAINPHLNAVVTLRADEARYEAVAAERALMSGNGRGALHGVPFTVQDVIQTAGVRTTCGSRLFADYVPKKDATCVARLKAAAAILPG